MMTNQFKINAVNGAAQVGVLKLPAARWWRDGHVSSEDAALCARDRRVNMPAKRDDGAHIIRCIVLSCDGKRRCNKPNCIFDAVLLHERLAVSCVSNNNIAHLTGKLLVDHYAFNLFHCLSRYCCILYRLASILTIVGLASNAISGRRAVL